ncbi:MAG TPA: hypothetical protein VGK43_01350 [Solirubrobacterales bacterium]
MIPVLEFVGCTPEQIASRIDDLMRGDSLARRVVVKTDTGERVIGTYERVADGAVEVEIDAASQELRRVPCREITHFGEYVPPLNRSDEVRDLDG